MKFFCIYFNYYLIHYAVENNDIDLVEIILKHYISGENKKGVFYKIIFL